MMICLMLLGLLVLTRFQEIILSKSDMIHILFDCLHKLVSNVLVKFVSSIIISSLKLQFYSLGRKIKCFIRLCLYQNCIVFIIPFNNTLLFKILSSFTYFSSPTCLIIPIIVFLTHTHKKEGAIEEDLALSSPRFFLMVRQMSGFEHKHFHQELTSTGQTSDLCSTSR